VNRSGTARLDRVAADICDGRLPEFSAFDLVKASTNGIRDMDRRDLVARRVRWRASGEKDASKRTYRRICPWRGAATLC
jgi:hypothetical protein